MNSVENERLTNVSWRDAMKDDLMSLTLRNLKESPCVDCGQPIGLLMKFPCSRCPVCEVRRTSRILHLMKSKEKLTFKVEHPGSSPAVPN